MAPARTRTAPRHARHSLSYQLAEVIESRGRTCYALGKAAGVDPGVIQRFLNGERGLTLGTADRLAAALGLRLVEVAGRRGKGRARDVAGAVDAANAASTGG